MHSCLLLPVFFRSRPPRESDTFQYTGPFSFQTGTPSVFGRAVLGLASRRQLPTSRLVRQGRPVSGAAAAAAAANKAESRQSSYPSATHSALTSAPVPPAQRVVPRHTSFFSLFILFFQLTNPFLTPSRPCRRHSSNNTQSRLKGRVFPGSTPTSTRHSHASTGTMRTSRSSGGSVLFYLLPIFSHLFFFP